jgi:hypothetical protein
MYSLLTKLCILKTPAVVNANNEVAVNNGQGEGETK